MDDLHEGSKAALGNRTPSRTRDGARIRALSRTLATIALLGAAALHAQEPPGDSSSRRSWSKAAPRDSARLLYKGLGYGSDAYLSPATVLLNKGFDIIQLRNADRNIGRMDYGRSWTLGAREVFKNPGTSVRRFGGWKRMLRVELLPLSYDLDELNWFVNYTEHFVGGGMTMRALDEWYRERGTPLPRVAAMVTTYAASILNEMAEVPDPVYYGGFGAPGVADLLFFDLAAVLFFHWDQPAKFLATTLQMADWSTQAAFTFPNEELQNNGQYFTLKVPIGSERTRVFIRGGLGGQFGLSRKLADGEHHFSFGIGGDTQVRDIAPDGHETVTFAPSAGVYYDRNNSLLWSVSMSPVENLVAVNVYPGVLRRPLRGAGVWAVITRHNELRFGFVHRNLLGLGAGYGR